LVPYADPRPADVATVFVGREARLHNGWYFRFALGWGALGLRRVSSAESDAPAAEEVQDDSGTYGSGVAVDLALGGTPWRGLGVAGWVAVASLAAPADAGELILRDAYELVMVGVLFDYFPWATEGLHFGVGLGLAEGGGSGADDTDETGAGFGLGFSPRFGYAFWIGDEWSLGSEVRGTFAFVNRGRRFDLGGLEVRGNEFNGLAGGALLLSLLHH
jgi:hypothetical protein